MRGVGEKAEDSREGVEVPHFTFLATPLCGDLLRECSMHFIRFAFLIRLLL